MSLLLLLDGGSRVSTLASGSCTVDGVSAAIKESVGASAGVGPATAVPLSNVGAAAGTSTVTGVAPFDPTAISGLVAWYDASDTSTITQSSGNVSQWNDKSASGYHATQPTGALQPTTGTRSVNGLNVLDCSSDSLILPSGVYTIPNGNNTVFFCASFDSATSTRRLLAGKIGAGSRWSLFREFGAPALRCVHNTSYVEVSKIDSTSALQAVHFNRNGSNVYLYLNGGTATSGAAASVTVESCYMLDFGTGSDAFDGALCEVIIYSKSLSAAETNQVGNYLATKWGFTWTTVT